MLHVIGSNPMLDSGLNWHAYERSQHACEVACLCC